MAAIIFVDGNGPDSQKLHSPRVILKRRFVACKLKSALRDVDVFHCTLYGSHTQWMVGCPGPPSNTIMGCCRRMSRLLPIQTVRERELHPLSPCRGPNCSSSVLEFRRTREARFRCSWNLASEAIHCLGLMSNFKKWRRESPMTRLSQKFRTRWRCSCLGSLWFSDLTASQLLS